MANLRDIAKELDVSVSTVSRALNGSVGVSPELQEKIRRKADEIGYTLLGRGGRATPDWNCAGIIVPEVNSEYYARIVHSAKDQFAAKGYTFIFKLTDFEPEKMVEAINTMSRIRVKCLLLVVDSEESLTDPVMQALQSSGLPVMLITAKNYPLLDYDCIFLDEYSGIVRGIQHLIQRGYKRIGCLSDRLSANRVTIFRQAMKLFDREVEQQLICVGNDRAEAGGYLRMKELIAMDNPPDAVFCAYDQMAIGAIHALNESGLSVPGDMAVLGFDNLTVSQYICGGITSIANPYREMISISLNVLLNRIANPSAPQQHIALKPEVVIRATT